MDLKALKQQLNTNPKKTVRFITGFSLTLILLWVMVLMQSGNSSEHRYVSVDSISNLSENQEQNDQLATPDASTESISFAPLKPVLLLLIIAFPGLYTFILYRKKVQRKTSGQQHSTNHLAVQESLDIADGQKLVITRVGSEFWVVGCHPGGMDVLKVLSKAEIEESQPQDPFRKKQDSRFSAMFQNIWNNQTQHLN